MDRLMPVGWIADWIDSFVDEWMISCSGGWMDERWVHRLLLYGCLDASMDKIMIRRMNGCMADLVEGWMDRLMPVGWIADWIDSFVDEWMMRCLGRWKNERWVHRLLLYGWLDGSKDEIMACWMKGCLADCVVRWVDWLMSVGWVTDWLDRFVDGWMDATIFGWLKGWTMST